MIYGLFDMIIHGIVAICFAAILASVLKSFFQDAQTVDMSAGQAVVSAPIQEKLVVETNVDINTTDIVPDFHALDSARNGKADDLQKIKGIGAVREEKLNALGIFHYDQILSLTEKDILYLNQKLGGTKIKRDDWIASAQECLGQS